MPLLLNSKIGAVIKLEDPAVQCTTHFFKFDPSITYDSQRSIITRMTLAQKANVQFLHTLGALVYIYVFGDRIGEVTLSGLAFGCPDFCGNDGLDFDVSGPEGMLLWYKKHRVSRRREPVTLSIGAQVLEGFVVGFTEDIIDPSTNLVQWGVTMATMPDDTTDAGATLPPTTATVPPVGVPIARTPGFSMIRPAPVARTPGFSMIRNGGIGGLTVRPPGFSGLPNTPAP